MTQRTHTGKPVADYGPGHPFTGAEIVSSYSRAQAIDDGILIDVSQSAVGKLGFRFPVAVTQGTWETFVSPGLAGLPEAEAGALCVQRTASLLAIVRDCIMAAGKAGGDRIHALAFSERQPRQAVEIWCRCGPGDRGEPVLTIMLADED